MIGIFQLIITYIIFISIDINIIYDSEVYQITLLLLFMFYFTFL